MTKTAVEENKKVGKIDINKLVSAVRQGYGKDKSMANQIGTGNSISRPTRDDEFVCWKDSPWEKLTSVKGIPFGKIVEIAGISKGKNDWS